MGRKTLLKGIGEEALIKGLAAKFPSGHPRVIKGIGDDAAVIAEAGGKALLTTTDILIEGTHFRREYTDAYLLGRKALSISLSDIAAMGGIPLFFLTSIALPPDTEKGFLDGLYRGLSDVAFDFGALLIGGNTARSGKVMVATTVLGEASAEEVVYRGGAREGDDIYVTGATGVSALGLKILKGRGLGVLRKKTRAGRAALKHLDPTPRVEAGRALATGRLATAMMDISDGLALDLKRMCEESGTGAVIKVDRLPVADELRGGQATHGEILDLIVSGGEDYELLFTARGRDSGRIASLSRRLSLPMTAIGKVTEKSGGIRFVHDDGTELEIRRPGFEHF
ncbi:MAG: thiamine-phosphate kinase [Deltaproteobacteria bacterium]|nr:thiamine-phosphate kinase [Deltaproteobacteria bacterium]